MVALGEDLILFLTPSTLLTLNHKEKQNFYVGSVSNVKGDALKSSIVFHCKPKPIHSPKLCVQ